MIKNYVNFTLNAQNYELKPTFKAIMEIEEKLGGLLSLALSVSEGKITFKDMVVIIWSCLGDKSDLTFEELGEYILHKGAANVMPLVRDILTISLAGELKEPTPLMEKDTLKDQADAEN